MWLSSDLAGSFLGSRAFLASAKREAATAATAASAASAASAGAPKDGSDPSDAAADASDAVAAKLQAGYAALAACALYLIESAATAPDAGKAASRNERGGKRVLAALDALLAPGAYLRAIAPLLEHADARARRKALKLIAHRLRASLDAANAEAFARADGRKGSRRDRARRRRDAARARRTEKKAADDGDDAADDLDDDLLEDAEFADEVAAGAAIVATVAALAGERGASSTRRDALAALDAAAARFAGVPALAAPTLAALPAAVSALTDAFEDETTKETKPKKGGARAKDGDRAKEDDGGASGSRRRQIAAAGAACLASMFASLKARCVPALPAAAPALLRAARASADGVVHAGALRAAKSDASDTSANETLSLPEEAEEHARVLAACFGAVDALATDAAGFLSPYLDDLLAAATAPALLLESRRADDRTPNAGEPAPPPDPSAVEASPDSSPPSSALSAAVAAAAALREKLPRVVPARLLVGPLSTALASSLAAADADAGARSAAALCAMAARCASEGGAALAPPARDALAALALEGLDARRVLTSCSDEALVDAAEAAATGAFVALAATLAESAFVPAFARAAEWAKARAAEARSARIRLGALFRLSAALSDALRGVFSPLAAPLLDLFAAALDPAADPPAEDASRGAKKKKRRTETETFSHPPEEQKTSESSSQRRTTAGDARVSEARRDAWRMRRNALAALRRLLTHDDGTLLDAARFEQLHPLATRCLTLDPPAGEAEAWEGAHLVSGGLLAEAVGCVGAMVAAAPDDALWKPAHRGVLMATREASARARLVAVAALDAVADALREEYLALLPEAIPFVSELFEDPDEAVEASARALTAKLTELSGEDLKTLMTEGGE